MTTGLLTTLPPTFADDLVRVLMLRDHNTRVVVLGVTMLGLAAGVVGSFMLLRKRALVSDAVSHAMLPGLALAFIVMVAGGGTGRSLTGLLLGAAVFGILGALCIVAIRRYTRLKDDVALAVVLGVFFGFGIALLGLVQRMEQAQVAGIDRFIYGKAASMLAGDAWVILITATAVLLAAAALFKEFALVCFDEDYARARGWPVTFIDLAMMGLAVAVTVIGLQAVGLILVVAMLIIPAAAARFWTDRLVTMTIIAAMVGMASGYVGASVSGVMGQMPTGPVIVLVAASLFAVSLVAGVRRGLAVRMAQRVRLRRRTAMQHLLRAAYEQVEAGRDDAHFDLDTLRRQRRWHLAALHRLIRQARRRGWIEVIAPGRQWRLTPAGLDEAGQVVRNHRLWELYLIEHADIAPSHVDRDADTIEHVLGEAMVHRLEDLLEAEPMPASPHAIAVEGADPSGHEPPTPNAQPPDATP
ncbi:MAG: iron chelate uptake ABC transporter family permease subunit [Phycisphaeraceae bacterium]